MHSSPKNKSLREKWIRFVRLTRKDNWQPDGRFVVCTLHFESSCFKRAFHIEGQRRDLKQGSVPSIKTPECGKPKQTSSRERRKVRRLSHHLDYLLKKCNLLYVTS